MADRKHTPKSTRVHDLCGMRFGRLTVTEFAGTKGAKRRWSCRCDCGNVREVITANLISGMTRSCGCWRVEHHRERLTENLAGKRFGRLCVIAHDIDAKSGGGAFWVCKCDCGSVRTVAACSLKSGATLSCGCFHRESVASNNKTHGMSKTAIYNAWKTMVGRCHNARHSSYYKYGSRGIFVCERWRNSFAAFFEDMGERPRGMSVDRIDNDGGYCCGKCKDCRSSGVVACNCRWATDSEQQLNTRRQARKKRV
jgi:hypothetical protein